MFSAPDYPGVTDGRHISWSESGVWSEYHNTTATLSDDEGNMFYICVLHTATTVVPLIRGHLGARAKVSPHRRCPLIRGTVFFQDIMQVQKLIDLSIIKLRMYCDVLSLLSF